MATFILLIAALVAFLVAALVGYAGDGTGWHRLGFGWLGAALVTVTLLIGAYPPA